MAVMHPAAAAAALTRAEGLGARRLTRLLRHHDPVDAFDRIVGGLELADEVERAIPPADRAAARRSLVRVDPDHLHRRCRDAGVEVTFLGDAAYPVLLAADPDPAPVLFVRGDLGVLDARRVAIVGTRSATAAGRATAEELARELAGAGVTVVSGLARGVDGAAHRGVQAAGGPGRPLAIVGSGPDVCYPRQHAELWEWVGRTGALVSEWAPGTSPDAWRFPQRNRLIAAASELVVVVESRQRGGSLITARLALDRGITVMAVPGSPRSPAAVGANALLVDGAVPVTRVDDVLTALSLDHHRVAPSAWLARPRPVGAPAEVLAAIESAGAATIDDVVATARLGVGEAAMALARLERDGWIAETAGWFEPVASRLAPTDRADSPGSR